MFKSEFLFFLKKNKGKLQNLAICGFAPFQTLSADFHHQPWSRRDET